MKLDFLSLVDDCGLFSRATRAFYSRIFLFAILPPPWYDPLAEKTAPSSLSLSLSLSVFASAKTVLFVGRRDGAELAAIASLDHSDCTALLFSDV